MSLGFIHTYINLNQSVASNVVYHLIREIKFTGNKHYQRKDRKQKNAFQLKKILLMKQKGERYVQQMFNKNIDNRKTNKMDNMYVPPPPLVYEMLHFPFSVKRWQGEGGITTLVSRAILYP